MNFWTLNYFGSFVISILLAGLIIPKILLIAFRKQLFDEVDERKIHRGVVPRLGGIAFFAAIMFSCLFMVGCGLRADSVDLSVALAESAMPAIFLMCAMLLMFLVGIADDLIGVRYRAKFIFQIIAGLLITLSGLWIPSLFGFCGIKEIPEALGWILAIFLLIYITNAINLIDGIDGLASGVSMIALLFDSYVFFASGRYIYAMICGATLGTLLPFFYYNVFGKSSSHTKIFMGDTGSLTIGLVLSFMALEMFNLPAGQLLAGENHLVLALAPILLPCLDVLRVFFHRVRRRKNPFLPDKCHIHHKLLALGFVQWKALIFILITDSLFIVANLLLAGVIGPTWLILGDVVVWTLMNMLLTRLIRRREHSVGKTLYE